MRYRRVKGQLNKARQKKKLRAIILQNSIYGFAVYGTSLFIVELVYGRAVFKLKGKSPGHMPAAVEMQRFVKTQIFLQQ